MHCRYCVINGNLQCHGTIPKQGDYLIKCIAESEGEREALKYLKRYIKGLELCHLKKLLKFLTGSDLMIDSFTEITVTFIKTHSEFTRRPIARTCGPTLELPSTYNNFCELRAEFSNILTESRWEMDIV